MQARGRGTVLPPLGVALEGDPGSRIDAVLAIAMLNGLAAKGDVRAIALGVCAPNLKTAQVADVVAGFLRGPGTIGMPEPRPSAPDPPLAAVLAQKGADGRAAYTSNVRTVLDTADDAVLLRNMLLAQNDGNASIVLAGQASGMARLLALNGAKPQIATKVKRLVVAIGSFPAGAPEPSVTADIAAARTMFAEWPTPLVAVGAEVGAAIPYPSASIESDFTWAPAHPVVDVYRAFKPMPYDAPASALAALLFAAHAGDDYFKLSDPGTIVVLDDGRTMFRAGADGTHRYLIADPAQKDRVTALYTSLVSAKPAPRPGRRGGDPAEADA